MSLWYLFRLRFRTATNNALDNINLYLQGDDDFRAELAEENSLTQEYLAAMIDVYYGLQGDIDGIGSFGNEYRISNRLQLENMDPMGWAIVGNSSPRLFFSPFLTYTARIDGSFQGTFNMTFDANTSYTYKSQYLLNARLTGF